VQARYALAVEGSEDGLFDLLIDSRATLYSPAFKHLLGYAPDAPLDASLFQLASRPASLEATLRDVQHTGGNVDVEVKLRRQDGQVGWFQLRGIVVRELTQTRLVGSIRDIDARKQAESLKDEFVATVSHELRTPLTSIHGSLALLEHTAGDSLTPDARGLVDITRRNTDRLRALVDDLLDVQKLEMGGVVLTREPCDVQDLLNETLALHAGLEEKHGVRLKLAAHLPRAQVPLDRRRIQQVLTNLVSNACKFAPPGSAVTLDASLSGDELRLRVSDLGPGVPAGFDAQLFQRFAQADSSAVRMHSGTGLGLYISRRIVESHGGHIGYRRENATSVFEVTLPAHGGRGARGDEP
jgi:PAS domain S-box-containing protein